MIRPIAVEPREFTRVFSRRGSVEESGSVGPPRVWSGQARRGDGQRPCEGRKAPWGRNCRWGGPRGAEDRSGRAVERAMEECDAGPAPTARVDSGAAGVDSAQAPAEVGAGRRAQPHAGPQIAAQQQAAQERHALLQQAVAAGWQRRPLGRSHTQGVPGGGLAQAAGLPVAGLRFLAARAVGHGQQGGHRQHQPVAAHPGGVPAARLVPLPADGFQAPEALLDPVAAGIQGGLRLCHRGVGQQYPGLLLTVGVQHTPTGGCCPEAGCGKPARCPPTGRPVP